MSPNHLLRRGIAAVAGGALLFAGLVATAPSADAAPVTVTDPASGVEITLSTDQISPGQRVEISGTGFTVNEGSSGDPLVAVRPYDFDAGPAWTVGGEDKYTPPNTIEPPGSEAKYWFVTDHEDGSFEGWLQAPSNMTKAGPLGNGSHWLRILSGAFFTTTGDRLTKPITFTVPFTVVDKVTLGLTSPTSIFQAGTNFRPGASVTVQGRDFTPDTAVSVALDGNALTSSITTEADGSFPASARVNLPSDVSVGNHALRIATGSVVETVQIKVTPVPAAKVLTDPVRPGGTVAFDLTGYIGVGGDPQKVAIVVNEQVLACIEADSNGAAKDVAKLPDSVSGSVVVGFNVGTTCQLPPNPINDQPISRIAPTITVDSSAPAITAEVAPSGRDVAVTGSGFAGNAAVAITAGSTKIGSLTADAAGAISGSVPAPGALGSHRILASDGTNTAAAKISLEKQSAALTLSAPAPLTYGAARTTTVGLKIGGQAGGGKITLSQGKWSATATVPASGSLKVSLPRDAAVGKHTVTAKVASTSTLIGTDASRTFTVSKAASTASLKVSPTKVKKSKRATATVRVAVNGAPQVAATGRVTIYDGKKKLSSTTLKASHKGTWKVKLPKIKKKGTHKLKVSYAGNANIKAKTSGTVKLKVV